MCNTGFALARVRQGVRISAVGPHRTPRRSDVCRTLETQPHRSCASVRGGAAHAPAGTASGAHPSVCVEHKERGARGVLMLIVIARLYVPHLVWLNLRFPSG
jgi:hypothetical protein